MLADHEQEMWELMRISKNRSMGEKVAEKAEVEKGVGIKQEQPETKTTQTETLRAEAKDKVSLLGSALT